MSALLWLLAVGSAGAETRVVTLETGRILNLFSAPSTEFAVIGGLSGGTTVEIRESWNDWVRIETTGGEWGWGDPAFLYPLLDPGEWRAVADPRDPDLNLRAGPGTTFEIVFKMRNGTRAFILAQDGGWRFLRHESGRTGWAWAASLAELRPEPPAALPKVPGAGN